MTKSTSGGYDQLEPSPEEIEQELLTAFCERRQTDRLKTNYRVDWEMTSIGSVFSKHLLVLVSICGNFLSVWGVCTDHFWLNVSVSRRHTFCMHI